MTEFARIFPEGLLGARRPQVIALKVNTILRAAGLFGACRECDPTSRFDARAIPSAATLRFRICEYCWAIEELTQKRYRDEEPHSGHTRP
jgi:hypothetical protein